MSDSAGTGALYYDRDGNEIDAEERARLWQDWSYRCVAEHRMFDRYVITIWLGTAMPYNPPRDGGDNFQTTVFRPSEDGEGVRFKTDEVWESDPDWQQACYSTELDARAGHADILSRVADARRQ